MKKGQLHISETVAVIFIFFVLVLFGIIFFYKFQQISLEEKKDQLVAEQAIDVTLKTLFLPELQCSRGDVEPEDNCIDLLKLRHVQTFFKENLDYYFNIFGYANINVTKLHPLDAGEIPWEIQIYAKEKTKVLDNGIIMSDWERKEKTFFVVSLRDIDEAGNVQYGFGYLEVEVFS